MTNRRILSVDWDYFFDYDREGIKESLLPDSRMEECAPDVVLRAWGEAYLGARRGVSLSDLNPDRRLLCRYEACRPMAARAVAGVYHHEILRVAEMLYPPEHNRYEIWHIDRHHDCYAHEPGRLTCGNWGQALLQGGLVSGFSWICNPDSDRAGLPDCVSVLDSIPDFSGETFDLIFSCISPIYTPPHADETFCSLTGAFRCARDYPAIEREAQALFFERVLSGDCVADFREGNLNPRFVPPVFSNPGFDYDAYADRLREAFARLRVKLPYEEVLRALADFADRPDGDIRRLWLRKR